MFSEPRKPLSLQILEVLRKRKPLSREQQSSYQRLASGYEGEKKFAALLKAEFHNPYIPIFSLNLEVNGSECPLDCILIFQHQILILDIKNFQGDYLIENNQWYSVRGKVERKNPIHQLSRGKILFQDFLTKQYFSSTVDGSLVFVHSGFHLYQAPLNLPIVFPAQLQRFIQKLYHIPVQLDARHEKLAKQLMTAHLPKSRHEELPNYAYNQLKRGIICDVCNGFLELTNPRWLICPKCRKKEPTDSAVIRSVAEFHLLFPEERITVSMIDHWCHHVIPKSGIRRILSKYLVLIKNGKYAYYRYKKKTRIELNTN
jgi:hypothetical protein